GYQAGLVRRIRDQSLAQSSWKWSALPQLFLAVSNFGPEGLAALGEWLERSDPDRVVAATMLLAEASPEFLFDHQDIIDQALTRAEALGEECLERVRSVFLGIAFSTARWSLSGAPDARDV